MPGRRMEKGERGGHATGPGETNQQRAEGEVLTRVPRARPIPEEEYLGKAVGVHQP